MTIRAPGAMAPRSAASCAVASAADRAERRIAAPAVPQPGPRRRGMADEDDLVGWRDDRHRDGGECAATASTGPDTPADANVAISSRSRQAVASSVDREGSPGRLAEPEVEREDRLQAELAEGDRVSRLGRSVGGQQPRPDCRLRAALRRAPRRR